MIQGISKTRTTSSKSKFLTKRNESTMGKGLTTTHNSISKQTSRIRSFYLHRDKIKCEKLNRDLVTSD